MFKKLIVFAFTAIFVFSVISFTALGENNMCTVTVNIQDYDKNPIDNVTVGMCKIADSNGNVYTATNDFLESNLDIAAIINSPNENFANDVEKYIYDNDIKFDKLTSKEGSVLFSYLDTGLWLVLSERDGDYNFAPYFINVTQGHLNKEFTTTPKLQQNIKTINVSVLKIWDDYNNESGNRPKEITINLMCDGSVVEAANLNEQNGWQYTFENCQKDKNYYVSEDKVEKYTASYGGDVMNGFIVTNTLNASKLPQTGQLWWPAIALSIAGLCFVVLGIYELKVKKNVKE